MGANLIIVVVGVLVIGGMGSIMEAVATGFVFAFRAAWRSTILVLAIVFTGMIAIYRFFHFPFGKVLKAIRENIRGATSPRLSGQSLQAGRVRALGDWPG